MLRFTQTLDNRGTAINNGTVTVGDAHALALIAAVLTAGALALRGSSLKPARRQVYRAAGIGIVLFMIVLGFNAHLCREGNPTIQSLVPSICIAVVILYGRTRFEKAAVSVVLLLAMVVMAFHYTHLVHGPKWTGNSQSNRAANMIARQRLKHLQEGLAPLAASEDTILPEGWVRETMLAEHVIEVLDSPCPYREIVDRAWHSTFTRLYPVQRVAQDYWYPGGDLQEAIARIELRDRSEPDRLSR